MITIPFGYQDVLVSILHKRIASTCIRKLTVSIVCFIVVHFVQAQPSQKTQLNPAVHFGRLENSLQYYILQNNDNSGKINLQLVVDAGQYDEDSDQHGLAHLVEHLALRSTSHFPEGLRNSLLDKGLQPGVDFVASTAETTNYYVNIPEGDTTMLNMGILVLSDFAGGISFRPHEIEQERSAVFRELARGNNQSFFALQEMSYVLLDKNPIYANHLLRDMENVQSTPVEPLIRFYKEWYHPKYQTLFVVGNVDVAETEILIKKYFSEFSNIGAKEKIDFKKTAEVSMHGESRLFVVEHGNQTPSILVKLYKKKKTELNSETLRTTTGLKIRVIDEIINEMLRHRLQIGRDNNPALPEILLVDRRAISSFAGIDAIISSSSVSAVKDLKNAIRMAADEYARLEKYGFSEAEFTRARAIVLSGLNQTKGKIPENSELMGKLHGYHLEGRGTFGNETEWREKLLVSITLREVNDAITFWLRTNGNWDVVLSIPDAGDLQLPKESDVFDWIAESRKKRINPYQEPANKSLPPSPKATSCAEYTIRELTELGAVRMKFKNGATVLIKSFSKEGGQTEWVRLKGFNNYYWSEDIDTTSRLLEDSWKFMGVSSIDVATLNQLKREKKVNAVPFLKNGNIQMIGSAKGDTETMLHLIYLYMAKATPDKAAFKNYCLNSEAAPRQNKTSTNDYANCIVGKSVSEIRPVVHYSNNQLNKTVKLYKQNFGNAAEFTFIITGTFEMSEMIRLVGKYIGALPGSTKTHRTRMTTGQNAMAESKFKPGTQVTLVGDSVNNVAVRILFSGGAVTSEKDKLAFEVANIALEQILFQRLREKEKGVYTVRNQFHFNRHTSEVFFDIEFETAPEDVERLVAATQDELRKLAYQNLPDDVFLNIIANMRPNIAEDIKRSDYFWVQYLLGCERNGNFTITDDLRKIEILDSLVPTNVSNTVRKHLNIDGFMLFKVL